MTIATMKYFLWNAIADGCGDHELLFDTEANFSGLNEALLLGEDESRSEVCAALEKNSFCVSRPQQPRGAGKKFLTSRLF